MRDEDKLQRRAAVSRILADRGDGLVVTGLGSSTYDCAAVGDHPLNFYLWGAMGSAAHCRSRACIGAAAQTCSGDHRRRRDF